MAVWEYIHGFAGLDQPHSITFFDYQDDTLYRDVHIQIIGQHGWELVEVFRSRDDKTGELRYEYFFKRNRDAGYPAGLSQKLGN